MHPVHFVAGRTRFSGATVQNTSKSRDVDGKRTRNPPVAEPDWIKENKMLRFDRDIVGQFGLKAARFVTYLECWLNGKVERDPADRKYTYDPAWRICDRTGLKSITLERIVAELSESKFIKVKHGRKNTRHYAFRDQKAYFESRETEKHVFALREDADQHGEPVAILLYNLRHWTKYNEEERIRLFNGRYWRHDTLKNLVWQFTGFLTKEQLRDALDYMHAKRLVEMIGFCDTNGVLQDDRFWITLMEVPAVDDYEPQNNVRPASTFKRDGTRIDAGEGAENQPKSGDKTPSPNDKTAIGENFDQSTHADGVTGSGHLPLISNRLFVPPEVAGAPSVSTQVRVASTDGTILSRQLVVILELLLTGRDLLPLLKLNRMDWN